MKNRKPLLIAGLVIVLGAVGFFGYKALVPSQTPPVVATPTPETLPPADESIKVEAAFSKSKDNTVVLSVSGLAGKITSVAYELTYESEGLIKGVNSGSKPIDVTGKDAFDREVYLGTCSRNICKPDAGVTSVSVVLEFTDSTGKKSQFSKEYEL